MDKTVSQKNNIRSFRWDYIYFTIAAAWVLLIPVHIYILHVMLTFSDIESYFSSIPPRPLRIFRSCIGYVHHNFHFYSLLAGLCILISMYYWRKKWWTTVISGIILVLSFLLLLFLYVYANHHYYTDYMVYNNRVIPKCDFHVEEPVPNNVIVLLRQKNKCGAFLLKKQSVDPPGCRFQWWYREDGRGIFDIKDQNVKTGVSIIENEDGSEIIFGEFELDWTLARNGLGYIYYDHNNGYPLSKIDRHCSLHICVTNESDISHIDAADDKWLYKASCVDPGVTYNEEQAIEKKSSDDQSPSFDPAQGLESEKD